MTIRIVGACDWTFENMEELEQAQKPWTAYLVTTDGEFIEIGVADSREAASQLRNEYFESTIPDGHPHRFFRVMGVASHLSLPLVKREYCS